MNLKRNYKLVLQLTKEEMKEYGDFFKGIRLSLGLTQKQMGEEIGASKHTVYRWENGYRIPKREIEILEKQYREVVKRYRKVG